MVTLAAGREAVAHLRGGFAMSQACRVVAVDRSLISRADETSGPGKVPSNRVG
jgi:hypothetical protein